MIVFNIIMGFLIASTIAYLFYVGLEGQNYVPLSLGILLLIFNLLVNLYGIRTILHDILDKL